MKKFSTGLFALAIAFAALAFTKAATPKPFLNQGYWFMYDAPGINLILPSTQPPFNNIIPSGCVAVAAKNCAAQYSAFVLSGGVYHPSGTLQVTAKKP